jgi:hypothetical protein
MQKRYIVNLTRAEREGLEQLVARERISGLRRLRASILVKADDDLTDVEIAEELEVDVRTVAACGSAAWSGAWRRAWIASPRSIRRDLASSTVRQRLASCCLLAARRPTAGRGGPSRCWPTSWWS